jgi:hypothetical protein
MRRRAWGLAAAVLLIGAGTAMAQAPSTTRPDTAAARETVAQPTKPAATPSETTLSSAPDTARVGTPPDQAKRATSPGKGKSQAAPGSRLRVKRAVIGVRHRAIHEFYDEATVKLGEEFPVGDTEYRAKVLRFVPDFGIDMETRQVFSKSDRPQNPAMQIATWEKGAPHDTSWAFLNFPPHFSKRALLAFQVLRIEFENHAPVTPKNLAPVDTTASAKGKR